MAFAVILFLVAVNSYWLGDGADARKQLIVVLVGIWALRITFHLVKRNWGHGEDVRYSKLRTWVNDDQAFIWLSLKKVFLLQGIVFVARLVTHTSRPDICDADANWLAWNRRHGCLRFWNPLRIHRRRAAYAFSP